MPAGNQSPHEEALKQHRRQNWAVPQTGPCVQGDFARAAVTASKNVAGALGGRTGPRQPSCRPRPLLGLQEAQAKCEPTTFAAVFALSMLLATPPHLLFAHVSNLQAGRHVVPPLRSLSPIGSAMVPCISLAGVESPERLF